MACEQKPVRTLYKKMLALYPREFKERLGETMEQTFQDLYDKGEQKGSGRFGLVLWLFAETAVGIVEEHRLLIRKGNAMKTMFITLRSPAVISLILVIPFMIMELVNRQDLNTEFPVPLFVILWLLPVVFFLTAAPIVRNLRTGTSLVANPVSLVIRVIFLVFVLWMWLSILIDQMPCFLGVPNCD